MLSVLPVARSAGPVVFRVLLLSAMVILLCVASLAQTGAGVSCDPDDEDAVLEALRSAYRAHRDGVVPTSPRPEQVARFSCAELARAYARLLDEVV